MKWLSAGLLFVYWGCGCSDGPPQEAISAAKTDNAEFFAQQLKKGHVALVASSHDPFCPRGEFTLPSGSLVKVASEQPYSANSAEKSFATVEGILLKNYVQWSYYKTDDGKVLKVISNHADEEHEKSFLREKTALSILTSCQALHHTYTIRFQTVSLVLF